jgi:hypothetical protein
LAIAILGFKVSLEMMSAIIEFLKKQKIGFCFLEIFDIF